MISEAILIPKIYARLQEIASNFSTFSGGGPQTPAGARAFGARFGTSPPYRPPFPKFLDPPSDVVYGKAPVYTWHSQVSVFGRALVTSCQSNLVKAASNLLPVAVGNGDARLAQCFGFYAAISTTNRISICSAVFAQRSGMKLPKLRVRDRRTDVHRDQRSQ